MPRVHMDRSLEIQCLAPLTIRKSTWPHKNNSERVVLKKWVIPHPRKLHVGLSTHAAKT